MAVTAITGITLTGYFVVHGRQSAVGAAIAAAAVPSSRAMAVLEQQRQQMIVMDAAAHTIQRVSTPKIASRPAPASAAVPISYPAPNPGSAQSIAYNMMSSYGWSPQTYFGCLNNIWSHESGWRYNAENASGAYGIPQALPGSKMASAGADWQTNPTTQIRWGLGYIQATYGNPCNAWSFWQANGWY